MSEKDLSVALKKASPTKSEMQVLVAELHTITLLSNFNDDHISNYSRW